MTFLAFDNETTENNDENEILMILFSILKRNVIFILVIYLAIIGAMYGVLCYLTYQYESNALLLVSLGRENSQAPLTVESSSYFSSGVKKEEINSYINLLSSDNLIAQTVDQIGVDRFKLPPPKPETLIQKIKSKVKQCIRLVKEQVFDFLIMIGLKPELTDREKAVKFVQKNLKAVRESDSNVIRVSMMSPDPNLSRLILVQLIKLYEQKHIQMDQYDNIYVAFSNQLGLYKKELANKQKEMEKIKYDWNIYAIEEQRGEIVRNLQKLELAINDQLSLRKKLASEIDMLKKQLPQVPAFIKKVNNYEHNPYYFSIKEELVKLKITHAELVQVYRSDSEIVRVIENKIKKLEQLSESESGHSLAGSTVEANSLREEIEKTIKGHQVQLAGIDAALQQDRKNLKKMKDEMKRFNKGSMLLSTVSMEYNVLEQKYTARASSLEQIKLEQEFDKQRIANVSQISSPTLSIEPAKPNKLKLMVIGIIAGLAFSVGLALLKEWFNQEVHDENDINTIKGVSYLGSFDFNGS